MGTEGNDVASILPQIVDKAPSIFVSNNIIDKD